MDRRTHRIFLFSIAMGAVSMASASPGWAQDAGVLSPTAPNPAGQAAPIAFDAVPKDRDKIVARLIANLMPRTHVSGQNLDDTISKRALNLFVESLDPLKLYFYQSDIDEFRKSESKIDDMVRAGDLSLGYDIFRRFTQRVDERVAVAQQLLDGTFDFNVDESIVTDPEVATYAKTPEESKDRWRRQIKYALLDLKDTADDEETPSEEDPVDQLRRRYTRYANRWKQTSSDDLLEIYLSAITMGYDPHSTYMSPASLEDFEILMGLKLEGIGAALREKEGVTEITNVIPGGAADKHGKLKADDQIVSVGQGVEGEMVDIVEMPLKDVVKMIRGKAGTIVRLGVKSGGVGVPEIYSIVRASVELEESAARGEVIDHQLGSDGNTMKIGYINLPSFYLDMEGAKANSGDFRSSTRDVRRIIDDFKNKGVEGIVLDLSRNGGGSLTEAINLTGLFIDRGPVVQVKNSDGSIQQYTDDDNGAAWTGPLVVLTSKFSASASEILAGAIQDYGRGIVVGDPATHGKGTVQTLMDIGDQLFRNARTNYGALKVTLQQFYLPDGDSTQRDGVAADIILPSITAKMDVSEADLKFALQTDSVKPASHNMYPMNPPDLIGQLRQSSATRVEKDPEWVDLIRRINLYVEQKEQDYVSLNEDTFMKRRAELDAQKEEEETALETELNTEVIFRDNFYNKEVINIAHEYTAGLKKQNLAKAN